MSWCSGWYSDAVVQWCSDALVQQCARLVRLGREERGGDWERDGLALQVGNQVPHLVAGTREEEGEVISNYNDKFNS